MIKSFTHIFPQPGSFTKSKKPEVPSVKAPSKPRSRLYSDMDQTTRPTVPRRSSFPHRNTMESLLCDDYSMMSYLEEDFDEVQLRMAQETQWVLENEHEIENRWYLNEEYDFPTLMPYYS